VPWQSQPLYGQSVITPAAAPNPGAPCAVMPDRHNI